MTEQRLEYVVDVAILSDFRLPGGTTSSVAEEVRAQSEAGITTALVHIAGSVTNYALGFSQHIRKVTGLPHVRLATAHSKLRAKLIIIRHPTVILSTRHQLEGISGDKVMIIANHAAIDAAGTQHYDIAATDAKVRQIFGTEPVWAPIGPVVRGTMLRQTKDIPFREQDWVNIFSIPEGTRSRTGFLEAEPVIGRHSRPQPGKWPSTGKDILAAYPDSADYHVRVLGGADVAEKLVGYVPRNWEVIPFGGEDPVTFLHRIDFWVYMHHPDLKEAFGRAAMEALAAGCVAIMPPYMEELFGDAALYAKPRHVLRLVDEYSADQEKFLEQSRRAQEFARGFSPQMHVDRLAEMGVSPSAAEAESNVATAPDIGGSAHLSRSLVLMDEPGDETSGDWRLGQYAEAAKANKQLLLVAVGASPQAQLPAAQTVHIPSHNRLNMAPEVWEDYLAHRLNRLVQTLRPELVAYEGVLPPQSLTEVLQGISMEKLWVRDRPSRLAHHGDVTGDAQVAAEQHFHHIIELENTNPVQLFSRAESPETSGGGGG